jgi:hypothetical protein
MSAGDKMKSGVDSVLTQQNRDAVSLASLSLIRHQLTRSGDGWIGESSGWSGEVGGTRRLEARQIRQLGRQVDLGEA